MRRNQPGRPSTVLSVAILGAVTLVAGACSTTPKASTKSPSVSTPASPSPSSAKAEAPVAVESNPPGDIPDSQAYVTYASTDGHFQVKVPEGWTRTKGTRSVSFTDKLNTIALQWMAASSAPTERSVRSNDIPGLRAHTRAFQLEGVKSVSLPAGPAMLVTFRMNSAPNDVTGKQYRDDVLRYALYHNGTEAIIQLISPVGADNVDPWHTVSASFQWK